MAEQKTTMSEESKNDVAQEARELLANAAHGPLELIRYDHGGGRLIKDVDDNGQIQRDLIADFYDAGNREFYSRAREIVSALCDEVEELRSLNQTQSDSVRHLQEQLKTADELHRVTVQARVKAENEAVALRDACQKFVHWYAQDSSEFNRDSAFDAAVAALGKRTCKECGALMDSAKGERCDHCEGRIDAWLDDPLHGVRKS